MNSLWNGYGNVTDRQQLKSMANEKADHFLSCASTMRDGLQMRKCATHLRVYPDAAYGTFTDTWYCKHRHCPICQWRKALKWRSWMHQLLDSTPEALSGKWVSLTLTTRNCHVSDLNETIKEMNDAFRRLRSRAFWKANVVGGIKFVEVDQGISDYQSAHPHFHCLLKVSPSMHAGVNYVSELQWAEEWQQALQAHYLPIVNLRRMAGEGQDLRNKIVSATRYSMKPRVNTSGRSWFLAAANQMRGLRLVEPFGDIRALFTELDDEASPGSSEGHNEIRQDRKPFVHFWDDPSGSYRPY